MPAKTYYSEAEAARSLGLNISEFRALVRRHIIDREEDMNNMGITTFHPADLLLLRMLSKPASMAGSQSSAGGGF